jgi:hypothetical protein
MGRNLRSATPAPRAFSDAFRPVRMPARFASNGSTRSSQFRRRRWFESDTRVDECRHEPRLLPPIEGDRYGSRDRIYRRFSIQFFHDLDERVVSSFDPSVYPPGADAIGAVPTPRENGDPPRILNLGEPLLDVEESQSLGSRRPLRPPPASTAEGRPACREPASAVLAVAAAVDASALAPPAELASAPPSLPLGLTCTTGTGAGGVTAAAVTDDVGVGSAVAGAAEATSSGASGLLGRKTNTAITTRPTMTTSPATTAAMMIPLPPAAPRAAGGPPYAPPGGYPGGGP